MRFTRPHERVLLILSIAMIGCATTISCATSTQSCGAVNTGLDTSTVPSSVRHQPVLGIPQPQGPNPRGWKAAMQAEAQSRGTPTPPAAAAAVGHEEGGPLSAAHPNPTLPYMDSCASAPQPPAQWATLVLAFLAGAVTALVAQRTLSLAMYASPSISSITPRMPPAAPVEDNTRGCRMLAGGGVGRIDGRLDGRVNGQVNGRVNGKMGEVLTAASTADGTSGMAGGDAAQSAVGDGGCRGAPGDACSRTARGPAELGSWAREGQEGRGDGQEGLERVAGRVPEGSEQTQDGATVVEEPHDGAGVIEGPHHGTDMIEEPHGGVGVVEQPHPVHSCTATATPWGSEQNHRDSPCSSSIAPLGPLTETPGSPLRTPGPQARTCEGVAASGGGVRNLLDDLGNSRGPPSCSQGPRETYQGHLTETQGPPGWDPLWASGVGPVTVREVGRQAPRLQVGTGTAEEWGQEEEEEEEGMGGSGGGGGGGGGGELAAAKAHVARLMAQLGVDPRELGAEARVQLLGLVLQTWHAQQSLRWGCGRGSMNPGNPQYSGAQGLACLALGSLVPDCR